MIIIEERQPSLGGWIMPWPDKEGVRSNLKVLTHVKKEYVDDGWGDWFRGKDAQWCRSLGKKRH